MKNYKTENYRQYKKGYLRQKYKTGLTLSPDQIQFYGYKDPLRKFDKGFGYAGVLSYSKDKDKVQCHFCGKFFAALGVHIHAEHKLSAKTYKVKVGLEKGTALIGEGTREKMIKHSNILKGHVVLARKRRAESYAKRKPYNRTWALEHYNKQGSCPDQLLDVIEKTAKSFGRTPTEDEFKAFHKWRYFGVIVKTYGSWGNALKKLNRQTHKAPSLTNEDLLKRLSEFYKLNKRTPRLSDMKRGLLPSWITYHRKFGSLNRARALAKVPYIIHVGRTVEEWMPTEEERQKLIMKIS